MGQKKIEMVKSIRYLGIDINYNGDWGAQSRKCIREGRSALSIIDRCGTKLPDMEVKMLKRIYEATVEPKIMYGIEIWGGNNI